MTTAVSRPGLHPPRKPDEETDEARFYKRVSFASDDYVPWMVGRMRLGKADLDRMRSSGVPVLRAHNGDNLVGQVQRVEKADGVWRSDWMLPKKPWNADTFDMLDSGVLRGVSVGGNLNWSTLKVDNEDEASWDDPDSILFSCDWQLVEESLTPLPADVKAGVDREAAIVLQRDNGIFDTLISPAGITTLESPAILQRVQSLVREHNQQVSVRRQEQRMTTQAEIKDIPQEAIERAIAAQLERSESLKTLTALPEKMDKLTADIEADSKANMEYRAKLDSLQFGGAPVLQLSNWKPGERVLDLGKVLRLTQTGDLGFPAVDPAASSLEESVIERAELGLAGRNVAARIPWEALAAREEQLQLQRAAMADGAGARGLDIAILGNAGLLLSSWSPILARMDVRMGVTGGQKAPWATAQPTAAAGAEGADIPVTNLVLDNTEYLPKSLASAYEITSSLRGVDDGTVEAIAVMAIRSVLLDELTGQVLVGGDTDEISGLWGLTGVDNTDYGAAQTDFARADVLAWFNAVRLAKTDGGMYTGVLSSTLWSLCQGTLKGGAASSEYLLEMEGGMGMMEGENVFHYADLAPTGATDSGLFFAADRVLIWLWGPSLNLEWVSNLARKDTFKMIAEANMVCQRPAQSVARIKQS